MAPSQEIITLTDLLVAVSNPYTNNPLSTLPYSYSARYIIRDHLLSLSNSLPYFETFPCPFTYNDGRSITLLHIKGSICYKNYLVPLSIWLVESYPNTPPIVYLSRPEEMVRIPENLYVDSSGEVSVPYLSSWVCGVSNLVDLVEHMNVMLYKYPPFCDPKEDLIMEIAKMISKDLNDSESEMEQLIHVQAILQKREEGLELALRDELVEKVTTEQQLESTIKHVNLTEIWLRENTRRKEAVWAGTDTDIEELFKVSLNRGTNLDDILTDWAIDDLIHVLDSALQEGCVKIEAYLRSIRALSREQFFRRATQKNGG